MTLPEYVTLHTARTACKCGRCLVSGGDSAAQGASVHVTFFEVFAACDGGVMRPDAGALRGLIAAHKGDFCECNPLDGQEHNYIELGGWLGSQETALRFIGLAHLLGLGKCMSPDTMMPFLDSGTKMSMAQAGMVTFKADGGASA